MPGVALQQLSVPLQQLPYNNFFLLQPFLIFSCHLQYVIFHNRLYCFVCLFLFSGLACAVCSRVFVLRTSAFHLRYLFFMCDCDFLFFPVSQSVATGFISLWEERSGRALGVTM